MYTTNPMLKLLKQLGQQFTRSPQRETSWRENNRTRYPGLLILTLGLMTLGFTVVLGKFSATGEALQHQAALAPATAIRPANAPAEPAPAPQAIASAGEAAAAAPGASKDQALQGPADLPATPITAAPADDAAQQADRKAKSRAASRYAVAESTFNAWQQAWRDRDVDAYLGFYSEAFVPPGGLSRAEWVKQRQQRLPKQSGMKLELSGVQITPNGEDSFTIQFVQDFTTPSYSEFGTRKELHLKDEGSSWKITQEIVLTPGTPTR